MVDILPIPAAVNVYADKVVIHANLIVTWCRIKPMLSIEGFILIIFFSSLPLLLLHSTCFSWWWPQNVGQRMPFLASGRVWFCVGSVNTRGQYFGEILLCIHHDQWYSSNSSTAKWRSQVSIALRSITQNRWKLLDLLSLSLFCFFPLKATHPKI